MLSNWKFAYFINTSTILIFALFFISLTNRIILHETNILQCDNRNSIFFFFSDYCIRILFAVGLGMVWNFNHILHLGII